jgi:cytidylate kinase
LYNFKKQYDPDYPIIVGLAGKAATGKTVVAETIVPKASFGTNSNGLVWDHIFFAMPLYEFYSIRTKIEGMNAQSRKLFATHETLYDLYGSSPLGNMPEYKNFVDLVNQINSEPVDHDGSKPRSFLQKIGDYCRSYDEECFAKWGVRKANQIHSDYTSSLSEESELPHCVLISDVRFVNEAQAILSQPNGIIIKFEASDQVRRERILSRDFVLMTDEQLSHRSEKEIDSMSDIIDLAINSDSMSIEDQVKETIKLIKESFGV